MKAQELMTENPACCTPEDTAGDAARLMSENDCGCLPVVEDLDTRRLVGVVTDRDLACRCLGEDKGPDTPVKDLMSSDPTCCTPDSEVGDVERIMGERQVRRVPVVDSAGCCVGMIAQADLARDDRASDDASVGRTVEEISRPGDHARGAADVSGAAGGSGCC